MFDTMVTVVGNALNTPEWRRLEDSGALVAKFKVATTSRRYDRQSNRWVDGASLRVRVNCWRRLAENVSLCVHVGDPLIITGRLYSREWEGEDKIKRISYELDAVAVGHDLSKGRGRFTRQKATMGTTTVEDDDVDSRVSGERTSPVPELNERPRQRVYDEELGGYVTTVETTGGVDVGSGFSSAGGRVSSYGTGAAGLDVDAFGAAEADLYGEGRVNGTGRDAGLGADAGAPAGAGLGGSLGRSLGTGPGGGDEEHVEDGPDDVFDSAIFAGTGAVGEGSSGDGSGDSGGSGDAGSEGDVEPVTDEPTRRRRRSKVGASV